MHSENCPDMTEDMLNGVKTPTQTNQILMKNTMYRIRTACLVSLSMFIKKIIECATIKPLSHHPFHLVTA